MPKLPDHAWVADEPDRFALRYVNGEAFVEDVPLADVVSTLGTPTYVYSAGHITHRYQAIVRAAKGRPTLVCYAVKANGAQAVLRQLATLGAGADIVSGGELERALTAGIPSDRIVFSGVGKTDVEIDQALAVGLRSINIESIDELERVSGRAAALGVVAPVALRVNPDVDPATHPYLATGLEESKFGVAAKDALEVALQAAADPHLRLVGLACHIGSQIIDVAPFVDALQRMRGFVNALGERGIKLRQLDLGGGFGVAYGQGDRELDISAWGQAVVEATRDLDLELIVEPGRSIVAQAGILVTRVLFNKRTAKRKFVIVDAGMNDLIRPSLYRGYHAIVPLRLPSSEVPIETVDVVGPVCESGDFLAKDRPVALCESGDVLAVLSAGAYSMVMASNYNTRPRPAEVVVHGHQFAVVRKRETVAELIAAEQLPPWLESE